MVDEGEKEHLEKIAKLLERFAKQCELCGGRAANAGLVYFYGNIGMFVERRRFELKAEMCGPCLHQQFLKFTAMNLFLGWWGMISFWVTPVYLVRNFDEYGQALLRLLRSKKRKAKALSDALEATKRNA